MALQGVDSTYKPLITDILSKILITSRRAFSLLALALRKEVLQQNITSKRKIPQIFTDRAQAIRDLITEVNMYIPMDKKMRANPKYRREIVKKRKVFTRLVISTVEDKLHQLRTMTSAERKQLIKDNLITLEKTKLTQALLQKRLQDKQKELAALQRPESSPQPENEVDLYDIPWMQCRLNLLEPLEGEALNEDQVCRLRELIDNEKYTEELALKLPETLYFAHWLSSQAIYQLVMRDKLTMQDPAHLALFTSPTENKVRRISLLLPFIQEDMISIQGALENDLDTESYALLENRQFQARTREKSFTEEDKFMLEMMGVNLPKARSGMSLGKQA